MSNTIHEVFVYLCVKDVEAAVDFYQKVFSCEETFRLTEPSGRIGHLELSLGSTTLMLSAEFPEMDVTAPKADDSNSVQVHLHVQDCDQLGALAVKHGASMLNEAADHFYGERSCKFVDPFGHRWLVGHTIEKVEPEEMQRRYTALFE